VSGTGWYGVPIRQIYIPPQAVQIVVYAPEQEVTGDQWVAQYTELPGYYVTETTLGYLYPDRWTLSSPAKGLPVAARTRGVPAQVRECSTRSSSPTAARSRCGSCAPVGRWGSARSSPTRRRTRNRCPCASPTRRSASAPMRRGRATSTCPP